MTEQAEPGKCRMVKPDRNTAPPTTITELFEHYCRETVLRPASKETYLGVSHVFQSDTGVTAIGDGLSRTSSGV